MANILFLEHDPFLAEFVADYIHEHLSLECKIVSTMDAARKHHASDGNQYQAVILNLALSPDNYAPFDTIPTITITGGRPTSAKKVAFARNVLDYIPDYSGHNLEYMVRLLKRGLFGNPSTILIVEDEPAYLSFMRYLLADKGYAIITAKTAGAALERLQNEPDISMMIVDGAICEKNEYDLIRTVRDIYSKNQLSIIALCDSLNANQRISVLRNGGSDCIDKPFRVEEFQARIMLNLQLVEVVRELTDRANRDFLTRLYNRYYFYEIGRKLFENYKRGILRLTLAMIDIDHLKTINDTHGHLLGDRAIKMVADKLSAGLRTTDVIARFGGEEFCVLCTNVGEDAAGQLFERMRRSVAESPLPLQNSELRVTVSIGVTSGRYESLEEMIHKADQLLYRAKQAGRNIVVEDADTS